MRDTAMPGIMMLRISMTTFSIVGNSGKVVISVHSLLSGSETEVRPVFYSILVMSEHTSFRRIPEAALGPDSAGLSAGSSRRGMCFSGIFGIAAIVGQQSYFNLLKLA